MSSNEVIGVPGGKLSCALSESQQLPMERDARQEEYARWLCQLGALIKAYRRAASFSQRRLAVRAQTTQSLISQLEAGTRNISVDTLRNVCRSLELDFVVAPAVEVSLFSRRLQEIDYPHLKGEVPFAEPNPVVAVES